MEVLRFNILPMSEPERHEAFKEAVNNCPICQKHLVFKYDNDFLTNHINEVAACDECELEIRQENHKLQ